MMRLLAVLFVFILLAPLSGKAEYEMHIPNCTQKGVENCGGFLFDNETGDVLFCGSESCIDLKLPKSWKSKQSDKQSKQDQIIEMLSNIQVGTVTSNVQNIEPSVNQSTETKVVKSEDKKEQKEEVKNEKKEENKPEKCDKEKKSLCKGSGGMQLGGTGMKLKKPTKKD